MKNLKHFILILALVGCAKQAQVVSPTATAALPTAAATQPPTEAPTALPTETGTPAPTTDPTVFGVMDQNEIQAFALESVVNAIFTKTFDGFVADGRIQEYQVASVTVFPGNGSLLAEVIYNVRTTDPAWLADGGTQTADGWINGNCSRFDFFTTDTEFQLKNKRLCG